MNHQSAHNHTPMHLAAMQSQWSVIECLVGWGTALDLVEINGNTPLHMISAAKSTHITDSPQLKQVGEVLIEDYVFVHLYHKENSASVLPNNFCILCRYMKSYCWPLKG